MGSRAQRTFLCLCLAGGITIILIGIRLTLTRLPSEAGLSLNRHSNYYGFLVDTEGCRIPNIDPYDDLIKEFIWRGSPIQCRGKPDLTYEDDPWLRINRTAAKKYYRNDLKYCLYEPIIRPGSDSDDRVEYTNEKIQFDDDVMVKHEFMRVYCFSRTEGVIYVNFHAFILHKPEVEERFEEQFSQYNKDYDLKENFNVIMFGVDSVSRLNMIRQMPKTREFLLNELGAVELQGYNKVADNTYVNIVPMTVGKYVEELPWNESMANIPFDDYDFVWKRFSDFGYRTLYAEDAPKIAIFNYLKAGFHESPADYYLRPFSLAIEKHKTLWNQNNHCFSNRLETNIVLDWVHRFVRYSGTKPYFAFTFITRLTHDNINGVGAADEPHFQFLQKLKTEDHLKNTILFYYSDHGIRFGEVRGTYIGKLEERLPFMFVVLPEWFKTKYPSLAQRLSSNAKKLTTPFDIYETLVDILYFNATVGHAQVELTDRGVSLFDEISPERTCEHATILTHWCTCQLQEQIAVDNDIIIKASKAVLAYINSQTLSRRHLCSELTLRNVREAWRMVPNDKVLRFRNSLNDVINRQVFYGERSKAIVDYQLTLYTVPGNGLFEVTIRHIEEDDMFSVTGGVSRINLYEGQSDCTEDVKVKKYCYCASGG